MFTPTSSTNSKHPLMEVFLCMSLLSHNDSQNAPQLLSPLIGPPIHTRTDVTKRPAGWHKHAHLGSPSNLQYWLAGLQQKRQSHQAQLRLVHELRACP